MTKVVFERNYSLKNGNKITKKNWQKIKVVSKEPENNHHGFPEIDKQKREKGAYYETWVLKYEPATSYHEGGFIFREINHNGGINGHHKTAKEAVWCAIKNRFTVFLEEETEVKDDN